MLVRFLIALILGGVMGFEREVVKKTGFRTTMLVAGGSAIFAMVGLISPYLFDLEGSGLTSTPDRIIANIIVGIGFLGAGLIIKDHGEVRGLTTAADIWVAAAVGTLVGIDLIPFAVAVAIIVSGLLYLSRKLNIDERLRNHHKEN